MAETHTDRYNAANYRLVKVKVCLCSSVECGNCKCLGWKQKQYRVFQQDAVRTSHHTVALLVRMLSVVVL